MACSWITNNTGEVIGALTEDGKKSKLFENLLKKYDVQQAQDLYEASRSDAFKEIYPSEQKNIVTLGKKLIDTVLQEDFKLRADGKVSKELARVNLETLTIAEEDILYNTNEEYKALFDKSENSTLTEQEQERITEIYGSKRTKKQVALLGKLYQKLKQEGDNSTFVKSIDKLLESNEATPEQVVRFVTEENQSKRELSAEQKVAVRNFGVADTENLKERLSEAFYDNEGVFFVSESKLINSGLYSAYEASNLKNDIPLQEKVKSALEAFKNTSDVYSEDISDDQVDKINTFNSFGKLVKVKKQAEPLQEVETFQEIDGQLVEEPVDNVDLLLSYKSAEENQELEDDLNVLLTVSDEVLLRNEATKTVLENVEKLAIADGLDLIGLADKQFDRPFMQSLLDFVISPNKQNTANFSQEYKRLFQKNSEVKLTGLNKEIDNKEYVVVNTTLSEQEVYKQKGFIKVEDNLYIKTNSQPLEELYEVVRTYTEKYPKEMTLEQHVQQETGKLQGFTNPEIAEAVVLYKMYFEGVNEGANQINEGVNETTNNFTGNYEYLTEDFPADFYKEILSEKKKDSVKYNNYYVHFGIDERGIYLNEVDSNTLENIKDFADENMKQYSVISKRIPNIADQTEEVFSTEQTRRDEAINNPNSVEKFTGEYVKTASDNVIAKNTQKEFIKVENEIYELWDDLGNLSMYTKVGQNNSQYFAVNTKKTGTREDLNSYTHLLTTPEKFINYKKNNEVEGFEC
jgi:hypothetical protein